MFWTKDLVRNVPHSIRILITHGQIVSPEASTAKNSCYCSLENGANTVLVDKVVPHVRVSFGTIPRTGI